MNARAQSAFSTARDKHRPIAAVCILMDKFSSLVAAGGCEAGDAALVEAASLIDAQLGVRGGMTSRLEPTAFTVLLPGLDRVEAFKAATALKATIHERSRDWVLPKLPVLPITVSVGVAAFEPSGPAAYHSVSLLFMAAKRAAEVASAEGGNCVRAFTPRAAAA